MLTAIRRIATLLLCSGFSCAWAIDADGGNDNTGAINALTAKIQQWQGYINKNEKERDSLQTKLKKKETAISNANQQLTAINHQISTQKKQLKDLGHQHRSTESQLHEQKTDFSEQLRSTFLLSQPATLKILLYDNDPGKIGRNLVLYRYLLEKKVALLEHLQDNLATLDETQQQIQDVNQTLLQLKKKAKQTQSKLQNEQDARVAILQKINHDIKSGKSKVTRLKTEKATLEKLVANLQPSAAQKEIQTDFITPSRRRTSLRQFKHRLPWPTYGRLTHRFGETIEASDLSWQGIFIKAPEGRTVKAIYPGKVVFADWLQGFGYLLIVDHGDGYLSLYARNQMLKKKEGDSVNGQEIIALAGQSGGFEDSGVYFELRQAGKPVNPLSWLKKA